MAMLKLIKSAVCSGRMLLKFWDLDPGRRSSFVFPFLFGKRALLVLGLDGVGNLGVDLGQGVVDEGEEVLGDVLEFRRLAVERRGGVELLGLGLGLSALVGLAQDVFEFLFEHLSANCLDGFTLVAVNGFKLLFFNILLLFDHFLL